MGTNFYWHDNRCDHCGRFEAHHVGKSSMGWSFAFRGYRHDPGDYEVGPISPFGFPVLSRADWASILVPERGRLVDEYGQQVEDPIAWLRGLQPPDAELRRWEDSPEARGRWYRERDPRRWRDREGFRFYDGDFS